MKNKAIQYFSDEYLENSRELSSDNIAKFLENFRLLHGSREAQSKSKLISMKVPEDLLDSFKVKAKLHGMRYQTQIKELMKDWLK